MGGDGEDKKPKQPRKLRSPYYRANDAGGYGNPPVSGQRKKGDPGGPGRPRGQTSLEAALRRALRRKRPVLRDGKVELLHPSDIMAERIVEALLAKNLSPAMIELAYRIMEKFGPQMPQEGENHQHAFAWDSLSDDELDLFGGIIARVTNVPSRRDSGFRIESGHFRCIRNKVSAYRGRCEQAYQTRPATAGCPRLVADP